MCNFLNTRLWYLEYPHNESWTLSNFMTYPSFYTFITPQKPHNTLKLKNTPGTKKACTHHLTQKLLKALLGIMWLANVNVLVQNFKPNEGLILQTSSNSMWRETKKQEGGTQFHVTTRVDEIGSKMSHQSFTRSRDLHMRLSNVTWN